MAKYSSEKEITSKYNRKVGQIKRWYDKEIEAFRNGDNVRKNKKADTSKEDVRQGCMEFLQENCRMQVAIETNSIIIKCCSCNSQQNWRDLQGGHKESRKNKRVCLHYMNVSPQCGRCNNPMTKPKDEQEKIKEYLIERYSLAEYLEFERQCELKTPFVVKQDYRDKRYEELKSENEYLKERIRELGLGKPKK